jgi:hypothetical protein
MKTSRLFLMFAALLTLSCSLDVNNDFPDNFTPNSCLDGQGSIVSEIRTLADFHNISSTIFADIHLTQGPKEDVIIEAQQNILGELKTTVVQGELRLTLNRCVDIIEPVKVLITIPEINNLTLTGVGDFIAENDFDLTELNVVLTGVGDFNLQGTTTALDISLTGVGDVKAFDLISDMCDIVIAGVGEAEVFVNDELNVTITGTGKVFYKGNPTITSDITGTGSLVDSN